MREPYYQNTREAGLFLFPFLLWLFHALLFLFGFHKSIIGHLTLSYSECRQDRSQNVSTMDVLIILLVLLFVFGFPLVIAFLIYYYGEVHKPLQLAKMGKYEEPDKAGKTVREREVIVKEIVMVPCQYCGGLMPQTSFFCPNCGARRKA